MGKLWNHFTSFELETLQFGDEINVIPRDWSEHFMTPSELFKTLISLLFPKNVGIS